MTVIVESVQDQIGIMKALDTALQERHEGIIIKNMDSVYECNKRGNEWIKLKPDYVDSMCDTFDLLILGGYYGEGKSRVGDISHFLLGIKNDDPTTFDADGQPTQFYTFCKVGTGYNRKQL